MEVSLRVVIVHFLLHVLVSSEVIITQNENFDSGLVLVCFEGFSPPDSNVSFQRNGMDIQVNGNGTLSYPLTQENEGNFTCTHDGQTSDPITLAGI